PHSHRWRRTEAGHNSASGIGSGLVGSDGLMRAAALLISAAALVASAALAQLPGLRKYTPTNRSQPALPITGIDALRADFAAQAAGTTIYFGLGSTVIAAPAKAMLVAQAAWLRRHPEVVVRVEGYGDSGDTR